MSIADQLDSKPVAAARIRKLIESGCEGVQLRLKVFVWEVLPAARDPDKPSIAQAAS
jgi:hypothetical protein